ncbi:MAG: hypothetical protein KIT72_13200 [Polyangiaceae bacterium]|nr:hypothetical protein [Polyangiaceae bacterium]MCW5791368.1 hypothetical protein [Polyangiaceae bacterium]
MRAERQDKTTLEIVQAGDHEIVVMERRPAGGGIGVGLLFLATGLLPFAGDGMTWLTWLTFGFFMVTGAALIGFSWPRGRRLRLIRGARELHGAGNPIAQADVQELELTGLVLGEEQPELAYQVVLRARPGRTLVLLSGADPAKVLTDLGVIAAAWDVPIRLGWGLGPGATPWLEAAPPSPPSPPNEAALVTQTKTLLLEEHSPPLPGGITILVGGALVGAMWSVDLYRRSQTGLPLSDLSMGLPICFSLLLVVLGGVLVTMRASLSIGQEVIFERRVLGLRRRRFCLDRDQIRAAFAVGPSGEEPWHIVLETTRGPFSVAVRPGSANEVLQALRRAA